jgi:hypothetical protein
MALEQNPIQNEAEDAPLRLRRKNGIKNASDEELESSLAIYEEFEKAFSGVVLFGVLFEFFLAYLHPSYDSPRGVWGPIIGDALVAIGILAEVFCGTRSKTLQSELTVRSNKRLAEAIERAANAERETERLRVLTAWRHLPSEMHVALSTAMGNAATNIDLLVEFHNGDPEAYGYACEFIAAFAKAGVKKIRHCGNSIVGIPAFGVFIEASDLAVLAPIGAAFVTAGVALRRGPTDLATHLPRNVVAPNMYVFVAPRPPPIHPTGYSELINPMADIATTLGKMATPTK